MEDYVNTAEEKKSQCSKETAIFDQGLQSQMSLDCCASSDYTIAKIQVPKHKYDNNSFYSVGKISHLDSLVLV